ncbi:bacillithiol biosynthesis deacetylase BshB1 [Nafulsella turpanensis]|uniref:bacillithiol biosynthesis deacetylase BshB1 n=1 Tax=Nafulsella turpanensis TaxID=1265690 RepID=UPI000364C648|nr:bacillithiol biosynthesis deacetylase BshB1 [Nafulsella turpanensis]
MKLDILVLAAHPDDAELTCSGTIALHVAMGKKVGIVDFTRGEMGTRGTPELRLEEAEASASILGLSVRENLGLADAYFLNDREHQLAVIRKIRQYQPDIVLANAVTDRHPDHGRGAQLAIDSCFLAGLRKIDTELDGQPQEAWRPRQLFHYIQSQYIQPDFVVDVSDYWEQKVASIKAFGSQFFNPESDEPETYISSENFMKFIEARAREYGQSIGVTFGEGFTLHKQIGVKSLYDVL